MKKESYEIKSAWKAKLAYEVPKITLTEVVKECAQNIQSIKNKNNKDSEKELG